MPLESLARPAQRYMEAAYLPGTSAIIARTTLAFSCWVRTHPHRNALRALRPRLFSQPEMFRGLCFGALARSLSAISASQRSNHARLWDGPGNIYFIWISWGTPPRQLST